MKVVIEQAHLWNNLLEAYPCLEKYREWYISEDDKRYGEYETYGKFNNSIIKEMNNDELFNVIQELTNYEELIIGYASVYDHEHYGVDFIITIYDYYIE